MDSILVEIFYLVDEPRSARQSQFCKEFDRVKSEHVLKKDNGKKPRNRPFAMSDSEVITIVPYHFGKKIDLIIINYLTGIYT